MNYIINDSLNEIIDEIPQPNIFNDFPNNPIQNDISENPIQNDPILNSMNRYLSSINNIINRQIEQEDNNIMQEAILASLREQ